MAVTILSATGTATGESKPFLGSTVRQIQANVAGTNTVTATVLLDVSNDDVNWILGAATFTLSGVTSATDGTTTAATWDFLRARCTALSATSVSVTVGD